MADFLRQMAAASHDRFRAAREHVPERLLRERAVAAAPPRPLPPGFLLIAEIKRISPAAGAIDASSLTIAQRARLYATGGAAVISVLTEPTRFGGRLDDLGQAAAAAPAPVMRKDFLVHPYQVIEARAHGASGVLLIARMLDDPTLRNMLTTAHEFGMFVLVEAFDREDLDRSTALLPPSSTSDHSATLFGLNTRDLRDLAVRPDRLEALVDAFPPGCRRIAESGLSSPEEIRNAALLGYHGALVGTALMRAEDPARLTLAMTQAGADGLAARAAAAQEDQR